MEKTSITFWSNLILGILLLLPVQTSAQFNLQEAFQLLEKNNLSLKQLQQSISQTEQEIDIQRTNYYPILSTSAFYNHVSDLATLEVPLEFPGVKIPAIEAGVKNQYDVALMLKQPVFTGFRTRNLIDAAKQSHEAERMKKAVLHNQLLFQVGQLFYQIQLNLLQQQVLQQSIERADLQIHKIRNFMNVSQATAFDTLEVFNRKLQISSQIVKLQNIKEILQSKFLFLLNVEKIDAIQAPNPEEIELILEDLEYYHLVAQRKRPELSQLASVQKAQHFQGKVIQSMLYPQVFANASYHYARPGVNFFQDEWMNYYTFGVNLQWELWNWGRTKQQLQKSKLAIRQLDLKFQELILKIRQEVTEVYQYLLTIRAQIDLQEKLAVQEKLRYQQIQEKFEQFLATSLDISDAENRLREAELKLQNTYIEWLLSKLQLDYATGIIGTN